MLPSSLPADMLRLGSELQRLACAASAASAARLGGIARGDAGELWRMGAEKPPAFADAQWRTVEALLDGAAWPKALALGLASLTRLSEENAARLGGAAPQARLTERAGSKRKTISRPRRPL